MKTAAKTYSHGLDGEAQGLSYAWMNKYLRSLP